MIFAQTCPFFDPNFNVEIETYGFFLILAIWTKMFRRRISIWFVIQYRVLNHFIIFRDLEIKKEAAEMGEWPKKFAQKLWTNVSKNGEKNVPNLFGKLYRIYAEWEKNVWPDIHKR